MSTGMDEEVNRACAGCGLPLSRYNTGNVCQACTAESRTEIPPSAGAIVVNGRKIAELRRGRGWTQEFLADRIGLSVPTVRKLEQGNDRKSARISTLSVIARVLDVPLGELLTEPGTPAARKASGSQARADDPFCLPADFWAREEVSAAVAESDIPRFFDLLVYEKRWTQRRLAEIIGYSQGWVSNVMRRDQALTVKQAREILRRFGAPLDRLTLLLRMPQSEFAGGLGTASGTGLANDAEDCPPERMNPLPRKGRPSRTMAQEKRELRAGMRDIGMEWREVAAEFGRAYQLRPRAAWREAHGWTLREAVERINNFCGETGIDSNGTSAMTAAHLCEYEKWPGTGDKPTGRKPNPALLAILASIYGSQISDLIDLADRNHYPKADLLIIDNHNGVRSQPDAEAQRVQIGGDLGRRTVLNGIASWGIPSFLHSVGDRVDFLTDKLGTGKNNDLMPASVPPQIVDYFRLQLEGHYTADLLLGSRPLISTAVNQYEMLTRLADAAKDKVRSDLLSIGAAYAGFITWLYQDSCSYMNAALWAGETLELGHRIQDVQIISHALVNKAMLQADLGFGKSTVELCETALTPNGKLCAKVRVQAMQQAAHGYSIIGERPLVDELLDRASTLIQSIDDDYPWGGYSRRPLYVEAQRATCYGRMSMVAEAGQLWEQVVSAIPAECQRDKGAYLARHAVIMVHAGQPEDAAALIKESALIAANTGSVRIRRELQSAWQQFRPWQNAAIGKEVSQILVGVGIN